MGGKRELELETRVSALLPAFETDTKTFFLPQQQKDNYFLTFIIIIFKVISCYMMRNVSHVLLFSLSRKWRLNFFSHPQLLLSSHFTVFCIIFPLQLPCLLQQSLTQICMYTFGCFLFSLHQPVNWPRESFSLIDDMVESHMNTWCSKTITS